MSLIDFPILYIPDPVKGRPLFAGQIFVGEPDLDPEIVINQKQLNVIEENGTVVPVAQPFILSAGGVPVYNGSPVRLDVDGNYSIKILNKLGAQVYYIENVFEGQPITFSDLPTINPVWDFDTLADPIASTDVNKMYVGAAINLKERTTGNGGGAMWDIVLSSVVTENTINIVQCVGVPTLSLVLRDVNPTASQLGIIGDGSTDQSAGLAILDSLFGVIDVANIFIDSDIELVNIATFRGGTLHPAITRTITINDIDASLQRLFDISSGGEIILNSKWASATWFNAQEGLVHDNGPIINAAIRACGRTGTVEFQTKDIDTRYTVTSEGIVCDFDEFTMKGEQFRVRIGTEVDIPVFTQNIRAPSPFFGLHLKNIDFFNNIATGTSHVVNLNAAFLFILDNVYIDKGPANGFQFNGICSQGELRGCIAEELQGDGFREVSGSVMLSYTNCQSFENGGVGFGSGNNIAAYGNSLVGCKAYLNGINNFNRGDAGVSITSCMSRNAGAVGIVLGASATNASVKGTNSFDDQGSPTQTYGYEVNHYSQDIDSPMGDGNITGLVNNNAAQPLEVIAAGVIALPSVPQNALIRVDTEAAAASDDLDQIPRGYTNQLITLKTTDNARNVTYKDEVNNLTLASDFITTSTRDRLVLQYDRTEDRWVEISRSDNQ